MPFMCDIINKKRGRKNMKILNPHGFRGEADNKNYKALKEAYELGVSI